MPPLIHALASTLGFNPLTWLRNTRRMRKLVSEFNIESPSKDDAVRFAIVVLPWMGTNVHWFSLVCGLFLASAGNKVTFIVDDLPFGEHGLRYRFVLGGIRWVLKMLRGHHDVIYLSNHISAAPLDEVSLQSVDRLAELNAVWALRGEMKEAGRQRYKAMAIRQLGVSYRAIASVLEGNRYDVMLVPGGVWGDSGIWVEHACAAGVRVSSFDSGGYGTLMLAVNGIAAQLQDIPRAFALLKDHGESSVERAFVIETAQAEIEKRRSGTDKFASQIRGAGGGDARFEGAVLVALNSSWDSAALGLHTVFENSTQWIIETTKYLLENTSVPVIVRQHPAERLEIARTSDDYRSLLNCHFGSHPRLHFIAADEPVNSYDLLEQVAAVVVYTSTIGIEAAAHGKVVVTASNSYYSNLGFVWKATNLAQYHQYLLDAVSGKFIVTQALREDALSCYYLTQCCNWVFSPFNPEGFTEYSLYDLNQLGQLEKVLLIIQALEQNIPVAYLNHLSKFAQQSKVE